MAPKLFSNLHAFRNNTFSLFEKNFAFKAPEAPKPPEAQDAPEDKVEADKDNVVRALKDRTGEIRRRIARLEAKKGDPSYAKIEGKVARLKARLGSVRRMLDKVEKGKVELSKAVIERIENMTNRTVRKPLEGAALDRAMAKASRTLDFGEEVVVGERPKPRAVAGGSPAKAPDAAPAAPKDAAPAAKADDWAVVDKGSTGKGKDKVSQYEAKHEAKIGGKGRMSDAERRAALRDSGYTDEEIAQMEGKKPAVAGGSLPKQEVVVIKRPEQPAQAADAEEPKPKLEGPRGPREIADERGLRDHYAELGRKMRLNPDYAERILRSPELLKGYAADMRKDPEIARIMMDELNKKPELAEQYAEAVRKDYPQITARIAKDKGRDLP